MSRRLRDESANLWVRAVWLDSQIRAGRYPTIEDLEREHAVSRRTAYNTVAYLRDALGAPVVYNASHKGYEYADPTFALPAVLLREGELLAVLLAVQVSRQYLGTPLEEPLRRAVEKMSAYLPERIRVDPRELAQAFHFAGDNALEVRLSLMRDVQLALAEHRVLAIDYYSAGRDELNAREIEPHFLQNVRGDWMLVAWDRLRNADRVFMLARMTWHELQEERFTPRPELTPTRYTRDVFLTEHGSEVHSVAIRFTPYQARWIRERRWHASQKLEDQSDGGVVLRLEVCGEGDLLRWVLGYGPHAEVLEPAWLRERAAAAARETAARYQVSGAATSPVAREGEGTE